MNKHFGAITFILISLSQPTGTAETMHYTFTKTTLSQEIKDLIGYYAEVIKAIIVIDEKKPTLAAQGSAEAMRELQSLCNQLDVPRKSIAIHVDIARIKETHDTEFSLNWFGIYNKKSKKNFSFQGIGGNLDYFPTPTLPITERYGNLYVDPSQSNIFLPTEQLTVSVLTPVPGLQLPITFGGVNLNAQRLSNFLYAFTDTHKTSVDYTLDLITKDCEKITFQAHAMLPIYSTVTRRKDDDRLYQEYGVTYQSQGLSIAVRPRLLKNKQIELDIYFKQANLVNYQVNRTTGLTIPGQILTTPPTYDVFKIKQKIVLNNHESIIILKTNRRDPQTTLIKIPFLDKLPLVGKLFSSQSKKNFIEEGFILITPSVLE